MIWEQFAAAAPEIARQGRERLERTRIALLGTLRADGSPRISPVEPHFAKGHLLFGAMSRSMKARDLMRDERCVLHSAISNPDSGESELKLYGRAREIQDSEIRKGSGKAWWVGRPLEDARVFSLDVARAILISWDIKRGEMTVRRWSRQLGLSEIRRPYP